MLYLLRSTCGGSPARARSEIASQESRLPDQYGLGVLTRHRVNACCNPQLNELSTSGDEHFNDARSFAGRESSSAFSKVTGFIAQDIALNSQGAKDSSERQGRNDPSIRTLSAEIAALEPVLLREATPSPEFELKRTLNQSGCAAKELQNR